MKKMFVVLALIFVANNCNGGSDTSHITDYYAHLRERHEKVERKCGCDCQKQEPILYKYRVWDVVSGGGKVLSVDPNPRINYPIKVELDSGIIRLYTIDGKNNTRDLLPSLYTYRVKIVKEE